MQYLEMLWYFVAFFSAGLWLLGRLAPAHLPPATGRALAAALFLGALGAAYLLTFSAPLPADCQPAGPAIFHTC